MSIIKENDMVLKIILTFIYICLSLILFKGWSVLLFSGVPILQICSVYVGFLTIYAVLGAVYYGTVKVDDL